MGFFFKGPPPGHFHGKPVEETEERKVQDITILKRLTLYLKPHKYKIIAVLLVLGVSSIVTSIGPAISQKIFDLINPILPSGTSNQLTDEEKINGLIFWISILLCTQVIGFLSSLFRDRIMSRIVQNITYDVKEDMVKHVQVIPIKYFSEERTGDVVSRITNDVMILNEFFNFVIPMLITDTVPFIISIYFMVGWNLELTIISLITIPLFVIPVFIFRSRARKTFMKTRLAISEVTSKIEESVSGIKVIQAMVKEGHSIKEFENVNFKNLKANLNASMLFASFGSGTEIMMAISQCIILWFGINQVLAGKMTIGMLFGFTAYLMQFFRPIMGISMFYSEYQSTMAASERIFDLLDQPLEDQKGSIKELPMIKGDIKYDQVTFGYDPKIPVLKEISFSIKPNETIAIVGPTGAGKSSMVNILLRFYELQKGKITIDGNDIQEISLKSLRSQSSMVLQETFLFLGSIKDNIRYGKLDANDEEIIEAAKQVGAHDFIERLPQGYDTKIEEGSSNISVGQRQMISFARALLANPRIIILDEATSSVDPYTELIIQEGLRKLLKDRTSIIIAHRLSTVRNVDRIIVLNEGRIVEEGNHIELINKKGLYYSLYLKQFREPEEMDK